MDDGTFIGLKSSLLKLLDSFSVHGPQFGLHLNISKCELFWPSGDPFPEFPTNINRASGGLELLGSPIWGTDNFLISSCPLVNPRLWPLKIALPFWKALRLNFICFAAALEAVRLFIFCAQCHSVYCAPF